jgi:hypothetical protein
MPRPRPSPGQGPTRDGGWLALLLVRRSAVAVCASSERSVTDDLMLVQAARCDAELARRRRKQLFAVMHAEMPQLLDEWDDNRADELAQLDILAHVSGSPLRTCSTRLLPPVCLGQGCSAALSGMFHSFFNLSRAGNMCPESGSE